jgi:hypothetical protein
MQFKHFTLFGLHLNREMEGKEGKGNYYYIWILEV